MKKSILIALVAGFIGFVAGNAFWYLASPLWIDQVVADSNTANKDSLILSTGTFRDNGSKKGKGDVVVFENKGGDRTLRFSDFEVSNGPDLEVWLVESSDVQDATDVTSKPYVSLGQLKGNIGDQNYTIPADVDLDKYSRVVIWCEQFGVLFTPATLANP